MRNYENADKMAVRPNLLFHYLFINARKQFIDDFSILIVQKDFWNNPIILRL